MRAPSSHSRSESRSKVASPLQRGSACLCCRKRKMKCDGTKPVCRQCIKTNRADDCEYDDGKLKSRTQILQEKIVELEERIKELEEGMSHEAPVTSSDSSVSSPQHVVGVDGLSTYSQMSPHQVFSSTTSSSPISPWPLPDDVLSNEGSSKPPSMHGAPSQWSDAAFAQNIGLETMPSDYSGMSAIATTSSDMLFSTKAAPRWPGREEELNPQDRDILLDIFLPHAKQCGIEIHVERLRSSLNEGNTPTSPHPALMNAMYLLGCHFSHSPALSVYEPHFLTRAVSGISSALELSDRLVNIVQASGLLAVYFYSKARLSEGYYHSCSAVRLAVAMGLHQIRTPVWQVSDGLTADASSWNGCPGSFVPLLPPKHQLELGEYITTFWQVYNLDKCWSVATGLPSSLPDDDHPQLQISTVWPRSIYEYESDILDVDYTSLEALDATDTLTPYRIHTSIPTLYAKAVTLFERSTRLGSGSSTEEHASQWHLRICQMEHAISRFMATVPHYLTQSMPSASPLDFLDEILFASGMTSQATLAPPTIDLEIALIHTLVYSAVVQLYHNPSSHEDLVERIDSDSWQKSLEAANCIVTIVRQLNALDYQLLNPIIGTCWTCSANVYIRHRAASGGIFPHNEEIDVLIRALRQLSLTAPVALIQAERLEEELAGAI